MGTSSPDEEARMSQAIQAMKRGEFTTWKEAARHYIVNYQVLKARAKGRPTNALEEAGIRV
jgi:hypothetical protein